MNELMMIKMFGDTFTEYNVLLVDLREMNIKVANNYRQRRVYDLFTFLVNKGYEREAADLWNKMIKYNFFVKP